MKTSTRVPERSDVGYKESAHWQCIGHEQILNKLQIFLLIFNHANQRNLTYPYNVIENPTFYHCSDRNE